MKTEKRKTLLFLLLLTAFRPCMTVAVNAMSTGFNDRGWDTINPVIPAKLLFTSDETLNIKIYFDDLKALRRDVSDDNINHHALLAVEEEDGNELIFDIKVKTRGNFRKSPANCNFPPLRLNFDRDQLDGTVFEGQNKLKLVTHCNTNNKEFEQYVLQEYLAYRLYNILTEKSFRVRLAKITYIDQADRQKSIVKYGFFIEDTDDMAGRNGCRKVNLQNIPLDYTDYFYQTLVAVYQYMIGNTDWSTIYTHNIRLIMEKPDLRPVPVPYDFDWCGMVNPVYAVPSYKLGIKTVEDRLFRGYERPIDDFKRVFEYIESRKDEIYGLYMDSPLSEVQKNRSISYLDEFFTIIADDELIRREFVEASRKFGDNPYYGK